MRAKTAAGWSALLIISLMPALLLFLLSPVPKDISTYGNLTHVLGQLTGLIGMTMLALTFILSTRISFIEDIFGGLDKVYVVHSILGGSAFILLLFHPILLVLNFIPSNLNLAAAYLLPSSSWSVNFGIIALLGMIVLLVITFYTKIKYQDWKLSHNFLGLIFIFAVLHTFLVRGDVSRDSIFYGYNAYAAIVSLIGLLSFSYSLFLRNQIIKRALYTVDSINVLNGTVHDITLIPEYKPLQYNSGQFVFLRFYNEQLGREDHPFSIASRSNDPQMRIIIKNLGDYTSRLGALKKGDIVSLEGPYGRFNNKRTGSDQVWIAAGIGVTPFLGMAEDIHHDTMKNKVDLYYSARYADDLMFMDYLKSAEKSNRNFRVITWLSSEKGRLTVDDIKKRSGGLAKKEFYLCGSKEFKDSISTALIESGVPKSRIFAEEFSFR